MKIIVAALTTTATTKFLLHARVHPADRSMLILPVWEEMTKEIHRAKRRLDGQSISQSIRPFSSSSDSSRSKDEYTLLHALPPVFHHHL